MVGQRGIHVKRNMGLQSWSYGVGLIFDMFCDDRPRNRSNRVSSFSLQSSSWLRRACPEGKSIPIVHLLSSLLSWLPWLERSYFMTLCKSIYICMCVFSTFYGLRAVCENHAIKSYYSCQTRYESHCAVQLGSWAISLQL